MHPTTATDEQLQPLQFAQQQINDIAYAAAGTAG
jgi:hypothetical protein